MKENIVADTSFYICNISELNCPKLIEKYLENYKFHIGFEILSELPSALANENYFKNNVELHKDDYSILWKPFFTRSKKHQKDGEYNAIGIALTLKIQNRLRHLILDDKKAKKFAKSNNFNLETHIVGTVEFIKISCFMDQFITKGECLQYLEILYQKYHNQDRIANMLIKAMDDVRKYNE